MSGNIEKSSGGGIQRQEPQQPAAQLQEFLRLRTAHLAKVAANGLKPDRLIKIAVLAASRTPELLRCDMASVFNALTICAELGLEPGGTLGGAYLVPYGRTCTLIIGYRGLIDLARRSGVLEQIEAHVVYERDTWECEFGLSPKLKHIPQWDGDRGKPILVYSVARLKGGGVHAEVMSVAEINRIRDRNGSKKGPWVTDWDEMAKKTVVRRGLKYVPMSSEMRDALERDDQAESGGSVMDAGAAVLAPPTRTEQVKEKLMGAGQKQATRPRIIEVAPGETEEQALARVAGEAADASNYHPPEPPPERVGGAP